MKLCMKSTLSSSSPYKSDTSILLSQLVTNNHNNNRQVEIVACTSTFLQATFFTYLSWHSQLSNTPPCFQAVKKIQTSLLWCYCDITLHTSILFFLIATLSLLIHCFNYSYRVGTARLKDFAVPHMNHKPVLYLPVVA